MSPPAPAGNRGGQGWACGTLRVQAGQAAGPSSPPASPYLFSYPLNSLSFLRGEEQGGWSGPGEPGAGDARDPKSYLADDAANLLQRQRQGWPRQRAAPLLPHPPSAHSLADGQWAGSALWPLDTGWLPGDAGAWQQPLRGLGWGKNIWACCSSWGGGRGREGKQGAARSWRSLAAPHPRHCPPPQAVPSPPAVTLPCMSMRRVRVMLSSVSSGLPPTPLAPSGDAMAGGQAEPAGHGGFEKREGPT